MTKSKKFCCDFEGCSYVCSRIGNLIRHKSINHIRDKLYKCEKCSYTCVYKGYLVEHKKIHSDIKDYKCNFSNCSYATSKSGYLVEHKKIHSDIKDYKCNFSNCSYVSSSSRNLVLHKKIHSDIKDYKCNFSNCSYACSSSSGLTSHKKRHSNTKNYKCNFEGCLYEFFESGALVIHERRYHTFVKPYLCSIEQCSYACVRSCDLKSHIFYWHSKKGQTRMKKEEKRILKLLRVHNFDFSEQHFIDFKCIGIDRDNDRCFIDFLITIREKEQNTITGFIFLEVDEDQHNWHPISCEIRRMSEVARTLILEGNTFPITFIRYNPNKYSINDIKQKVDKTEREKTLADVITNWTFDQPLSVYYMYYDQKNNKPSILDDFEYDNNFKQFYVGCI